MSERRMKLGSLFSGQEGEVFKPFPIEEYKDFYLISNLGNVYSIRSHKMLKAVLSTDGYRRVHVSVNGKVKIVKISRMVAMAFIPNPLGKPTVNHKNEIKTDDRVGNLEWATVKEQNNYGTRTQRAMANTDWAARTLKMNYEEIARKHDYKHMQKKQMKPVMQLTLDGKVVNQFISISEAKRQTGASHIDGCLNGTRRTSGGYRWKYAE